MMNGNFIVFEGIDGSGKSTQAKILAERLRAEGYQTALTREPSDGPIGVLIRQVLSGRLNCCEKTMAALFAADRLDHLTNQTNGILRQLEQGTQVICDRYYLSTYAYQSIGVDLDWAKALNAEAAKTARPAVQFFLDISVDKALERIKANRTQTDIYETRERLEHTKKRYLEVIEQLKNEENIVIIDGGRSTEEIAAEIWANVQPLLKQG